MQASRETIDYDANGYDYREYWQGREYEQWAEERALQRLIPKLGFARWFADFGGAYGRNAPHYLGRSEHAVILDYSATNLANAAKLHERHVATGKLTLVRCDLNAIPFRDSAFDAAMVVRVLHHLLEADPALAEMSRTISGRWLVDVPIKHHVLGLVRGVRTGTLARIRDAEPLITGESDEKYANFQLAAVRHRLQHLGWQVQLAASVNNFRRWDYVLPKQTVDLARPLVQQMELAAQFVGRGWWGPSQFVLADRGAAGTPLPVGTSLAERLRCPACHGPLDLTGEGAACASCEVTYPHRDGYWDFA